MLISDLLGRSMEWALMLAMVTGVGAIAQAQDAEPQDEGRVIQIGPADEGRSVPSLPPPGSEGEFEGVPQEAQPEAPKYWIGLLGGAINADHPLRAHVDIPENQGLLVAQVVPNSPAEKAGLNKHDILLRANDIELRDMRDLVDLVRTEGEKKGQITLEVLRRGQRESVYLTPEERPADVPQASGGFGEGFGGGGFGEGFGGRGGFGGEGIARELLREFGNRPFEFRDFGPGVIVGGEGVANIPNGVSVSIEKQDGHPTRIIVKRGDETWEVTGDDPESLKQLPEDVRPFVERMLHGGGIMGRGNFRMPNRIQPPDAPGFNDERIRQRLERMEQHMEELQQRLLGEQPANQANDQDDQVK